MAKKKKNRYKKSKQGNSSEATSPEVILKLSEDFLAAGKPFRAREGFRRLFKLDPDVYRERYIEVTQIAIVFASTSNKTTQARQWLDYLKNELGVDPEQLKYEELNLARALGDKSAIAALALIQLDSEDESQRLSGADSLVLNQAPEAAEICHAINQLCQSEWNEMHETLQEIGRKSPFSHWRLFLRGCAAYYQNDSQLAKACFSRLPAGTIPARKSEAFEDWHDEQGSATPSESKLQEVCALLGEPKMASAITKSNEFWKKRQYLKCYEAMKNSGAPFPDFKVNLSGQLTRFFQRADTSLNHDDRHRWADFANRELTKTRFNSEADQYVFTNTLIHSYSYNTSKTWSLHQKSRVYTRGQSARFHALCYLTRTASKLILECPCDDCAEQAHQEVIPLLLQAVKTDPDYEKAYVKLLESYQILDMKSEKNKLLDEMSKRFPESQSTLLAAGSACLDRKSYVKGLGYLKKAREASPLDREVVAEIRRGLLEKAIDHYTKGTPPQILKAREAFEELLKDLPSNLDFTESREVLFLRWSVLEELAVAKRESLKDEKRAQAEKIDAHVVEFCLVLYREYYAMQLKGDFSMGQPKMKIKGPKTPEQALMMLQILFQQIYSDKKDSTRNEWFYWLESYIDKSLPKLTLSDRNLAIEIYQGLEKTKFPWDKHPTKLLKRWLKLDKNDPLFSVWLWDNKEALPSQAVTDKIRVEAENRGDQMALTALAAYQKKLEDYSGFDDLPDVFDYDFDDYEEDPHDIFDPLEPMDIEGMLASLQPMTPAQRISFLISQGVSKKQAGVISAKVDLLGNPDQPDLIKKAKKSQTTPQQSELPF